MVPEVLAPLPPTWLFTKLSGIPALWLSPVVFQTGRILRRLLIEKERAAGASSRAGVSRAPHSIVDE
jgi:hypothetical protein